MSRARRLVHGAIALGVVIPLLASGGAAEAHSPTSVLLEGLSVPKGLAIALDGRSPVVAQGAFEGTPPGPVLQYQRDGSTVELTEPFNIVDVVLTPDGAGWAIGIDKVLYRQDPSGTITPVLDIAAYQAADPDAYDLDGDGDQSNPYGLAALRNGDVLLADAQNNDVLRVKPDGRALTVARFVPELVATDHLPPEFGITEPEIPAEAVPTGIAIGKDGYAYVSELRGFPFRPGSSRVWRLNPWARDAECSSASHRACKVAVDGLTALVDIAIDRRTGAMYTYGLAAEGTLAFEAGFETGVFPPAVLTEIWPHRHHDDRHGDDRHHHHHRELATGMLSQPGGVAVAKNGALYVTDGIFGNGRLVRIKR